MSENYNTFQDQPSQQHCQHSDEFKEAVCIDAYRVYDSCADKDCLENMRIYFTEAGQRIINQACSLRIKDVNVLNVYTDLEPVPFNKGFYSIDMTFFFEITLDVFMSPSGAPVSVCGLSIHRKKVILFGSEGNVKIFSSESDQDDLDVHNHCIRNLPRATVQVADPIGLSAKIYDCPNRQEAQCRIPECICHRFGGDFCCDTNGAVVYASIGLFTIVQLERNVQMLIPTYDFCIPHKECVTTSDNPCELFSKLDFPTDEFFPPKVIESNDIPNSGSCGCCHK